MKPVAVIISDVHYNLQTLDIADKAMNLAIDKANELDVPIIVCGDLHDSKANIRAECMNMMIDTFYRCKTHSIILRGNHCSLNEKSEDHALEFLSHTSQIIRTYGAFLPWYFIAYQHDAVKFKMILDGIPKGSTVFCHQGIQGADMGHYVQDKAAIPRAWLDGYRVISGHYHIRQKIGDNIDYVGNPYTLDFGEANHPPKGFQILNDDGSLEFVPTNLRKHRITTVGWGKKDTIFGEDFFWGPILKIEESDILCIKVKGPKSKLIQVTKDWCRTQFDIPCQNFKLDLIPDEISFIEIKEQKSQSELLDATIDSIEGANENTKLRLKTLWKQLK